MRFKSIQFSVALLAGASVLAVVVALVLYSLFAGARTQDMVKSSTQSLLEDMIKQRLTTLAQGEISQIQKELNYPLVVATSLAQTNASRLSHHPRAIDQPSPQHRGKKPQAGGCLHRLGTQCLWRR
jgi:uncharacterized membrane protein YukC